MKPLSREELLKRGKCCKLGCKNCPWEYKKVKDRFEDQTAEWAYEWIAKIAQIERDGPGGIGSEG